MRTMNRNQEHNLEVSNAVAKICGGENLTDNETKFYNSLIVNDLSTGNHGATELIDIMKALLSRPDYALISKRGVTVEPYKRTLINYLKKPSVDVALFTYIKSKLDEEITIENPLNKYMNDAKDRKFKIIDYFTTEELLEIEDILLSKKFPEKSDPYAL